MTRKSGLVDADAVVGKYNPSAEILALRDELTETRSALREYRKTHGSLESMLSAVVEQIHAMAPQPLVYAPEKGRRVSAPCDLALHLSDLHFGAVQDPDEVEGFGVYNPDIAKARLRNLAKDVLNWVEIQRTGYVIPRCHVLCTGDWCCFPGDTEITLSDGSVKPISEVAIGDEVLGDPGPGRVSAVHPRPVRDGESLVRIKVAGGPQLRATPEHVVKCLPREAVETGWNPGGKRAVPFVIRDKAVLSSAIEERPVGALRPRDYLVIRAWRPTDGPSYLSLRAVTGLELVEKDGGLFKKVRGASPAVASSDRVEVDSDLLWLLGMYLAEGSSSVGRSGCTNSVVFTLNIAEDGLVAEISRIIREKFGYTPTIAKRPAASVQKVVVGNQIIATFLVQLCGGRGKVENKRVAPAIYRSPRSLLPLVAGWLDGDGGFNPRRAAVVGVSVNPSLARQMSTILWSERLANTVSLDTHGRNRTAYRVALTGESGQTIASYSKRFSASAFTPTYECGVWVEDSYCVPITALSFEPASGTVYDLTVEGEHRYQANGYVVHNSGDIHEELRVTNAFPAPVQAVEAGVLTAEIVQGLARHFAEVVVHFVTDDNHGRLTKKPQAKEGGLNNFGYVTGSVLQKLLAAQTNVKVNLITRPWDSVECNGRRYLLTHGHHVMGWAGFPYYGIERLVAREALKRMNAADIRKFDKVVMGHWHAPLAHPWYWIGGSCSGTDAFDHGQGRHAVPQQVTWLIHPKHGEFSRTEWRLKE